MLPAQILQVWTTTKGMLHCVLTGCDVSVSDKISLITLFSIGVSSHWAKTRPKRHQFNVSVDRPKDVHWWGRMKVFAMSFLKVFLTFNYWWCQPELHVRRRPKRALTRCSNIEPNLHVHQTYRSGSGLTDVIQAWCERLPDVTCLLGTDHERRGFPTADWFR